MSEKEGEVLSVVEVFEFIQKTQERKQRVSEHLGGMIKASFESLIGPDGDIKAVKLAYVRWQMTETERKRFDATMKDCSKQLGFEFDMKESFIKIESEELQSLAAQVMAELDESTKH